MKYYWKEPRKSSAKREKRCSIIVPLLLTSLFILFTSFEYDFKNKELVNSNSLVHLNKGLQAFGFRTQEQWESKLNETNAYMSSQKKVLTKAQWDKLREELIMPYYPEVFTPGFNSTIKYMLYPYWQGKLFTNYSFENIERIGYFGYIIDHLNGEPDLTYSWTVNNVTERAKLYGTKVDLVLYCDGANETDQFLKNQKARSACIDRAIMLVNHRNQFPSVIPEEDSLNTADGINVFLPDFTFKNKRDFGLFIKELFFKFRYNKPDKKLTVTFPERDTVYFEYLEGLNKFIDELHLTDYNYRGIMNDTATTYNYSRSFLDRKDNLNLFEEMISEIQLAEFYNPIGKKDIEDNWLIYFISICAIFLTIFVTIILYFFWSTFNQFVTNNKSIIFLVGSLLLTEALFLFIFMVEEMNFDTWLINTNNSGSYYFLLIPLILIFIFPLINLVQKQRQLP